MRNATTSLSGQLVIAMKLAIVALMFSIFSANAAETIMLEFGGIKKTSELRLSIGKSQIIYSREPLDQVVIGNPEIADIKLLSSRQVLILGSKPGHTNLVFRDKNRSLIAVMDVVVGYDVEGIKRKLYEVIPHEEGIEVRGANDQVMLSGQVSNALAMDTAISIASSYVPKNKVINMLQVGGGQQVMLEVRIAEIARRSAKELGIGIEAADSGTSGIRSFNFSNGVAATGGALNSTGSVYTDASNTFGSLAISDLTGNIAETLTLRLRILETEGLAKTLAEPNLVAMSGQEASFLAGGEFPYQIVGATGNIGNEFKEFGVGLKFTPTVLNNQKINLRLNAEVSAIDASGGNPPPINTRRAATTIEMADGQSFAIAGLLQNDIQNALNQIPGLGDIPILGALFRSSKFQRQETELVVIVTPRLVKPVSGEKLTAPTDNFVPASWMDQYLLGNLEGSPKRVRQRDKKSENADMTGSSTGIEGEYGHKAYDDEEERTTGDETDLTSEYGESSNAQ
jgi:pilus assembly protein CpaC